MTEDEKQIIKPIVDFLTYCGEPGIEAAIGALYGVGPTERVEKFEEELLTAVLQIAGQELVTDFDFLAYERETATIQFTGDERKIVAKGGNGL